MDNIRIEVANFYQKIRRNLAGYETIFDVFGYWIKPINSDFPRVPGPLNKAKYIDLGNDETIPLSAAELSDALSLFQEVHSLIENRIPATSSQFLQKLNRL